MHHEALAWHSTEELGGSFCMIRIGLIIHRWRAVPWAWQLRRAVQKATCDPAARPPGLLVSERILIARNHFGYLMHWRSLEELLSWAHASPHTDWWREAVQRQRTRHDFSIYHETYCMTPGGFEAIYLNLAGERPGASAFGELRPAKGAFASSKGRLGLIGSVEMTGEAAKIAPKPGAP